MRAGYPRVDLTEKNCLFFYDLRRSLKLQERQPREISVRPPDRRSPWRSTFELATPALCVYATTK